MSITKVTRIAVAFLLGSLAIPSVVSAADDQAVMEMMKSLQSQVEALQKQLNEVQAQTRSGKQADKANVTNETVSVAAVDNKEAVPDKKSDEVLPGVRMKTGGYIDMSTLYRTKNQTSDMSSNFNTGIPFKNSANYDQGEFRASARQTRLSMLLDGDVDDNMKLSGYIESDFMGGGVTSNSVSSNSYTPRLRQAFIAADRTDWGVHFLAGQAFSLMTANTVGIMPRKENGLSIIDTQPIPGFLYTRNPQFRIVKDFADKKFWVGLSAESPQANLTGVPAPNASVTAASGINYKNAGGSALNSTTSYSSDLAPDVIVKFAADLWWGHYEVFGITRFFHNNEVATRDNNYATAVAGGVHAILPVVKDRLTLRGTVAAGQSLGRYGGASLPDFAISSDGSIEPLTEYSVLLGANFTPNKTWDIYTYVSGEWLEREESDDALYGYGSRSVDNSGCYVAGGTCPAMTSGVWSVTGGLWKEVYQGNLGQLKLGAQYTLARRDAFSDAQDLAPHSYENIVMTSVRYFPFN